MRYALLLCRDVVNVCNFALALKITQKLLMYVTNSEFNGNFGSCIIRNKRMMMVWLPMYQRKHDVEKTAVFGIQPFNNTSTTDLYLSPVRT